LSDSLRLEPGSSGDGPSHLVVLMSTFNGERFLAEQLQSILSQLPENGQICIRDDGSTDGTVAVIQAQFDPRITLTQGRNLGFGMSFLTLLSQAPAHADLVMFADQDDVWLPGKIGRAWQLLAPWNDRPALYGSAQMLADVALRPLHATAPWARGPSLANALTENIITGCTAALNQSAVQLLQRAGVPQGVHFHDWWLYLVVSAFGTVVHDNEPTLLYRQHGGNQIGHGVGWFGRQVGIVKFLSRNDWVGILLGQVKALMVCYGDQLPAPVRALVTSHFAFTPNRVAPMWTLVFSKRRWRHSLVSDVLFRLLLAAHKLRLWPLPKRRIDKGN
jgi:glycosyltransferase involved in cell wall biosynthesis